MAPSVEKFASKTGRHLSMQHVGKFGDIPRHTKEGGGEDRVGLNTQLWETSLLVITAAACQRLQADFCEIISCYGVVNSCIQTRRTLKLLSFRVTTCLTDFRILWLCKWKVLSTNEVIKKGRFNLFFTLGSVERHYYAWL